MFLVRVSFEIRHEDSDGDYRGGRGVRRTRTANRIG
jgi:hypothetical protein